MHRAHFGANRYRPFEDAACAAGDAHRRGDHHEDARSTQSKLRGIVRSEKEFCTVVRVCEELGVLASEQGSACEDSPVHSNAQ